jgi:beta-1,4-N-acetylglucosaminyltransferase
MGEKSKSILLVTVGSTLFPRLTDTVLSAPVLESLADQISVLRVQLGRAQFPPGLRRLIGDADYENEESMRGRHGKMEVEIFRFTSDFEGLVASSDLVISHAGSLQS